MQVRLLAEGDEEQMITLLKEIFGGWYDRRYWNWLYKQNPVGEPAVGVAVDEGRIVASYSVCPVMLRIGSQPTVAGLALDAATHPEYRRRGLFMKVAEAAFSDAENKGFRFILGYTEWGGPAAIGQISKLGFRRAYSVKRLVKVLNWLKFLSWESRLHLIRPSIPQEVVSCIEKVAPLMSGVQLRVVESIPPASADYDFNLPEGSVAFQKSSEQLRWRYFEQPVKRYLILTNSNHATSGAFVVINLRLEKGMNIAEIIDIFGDNGEWSRLISQTGMLLRRCGITLLEAYVSEGHPAAALMKSQGFHDRPHALTVIFRETRNTKDSDRELSVKPERWHTAVADDISFTG